MGGLAIMTPVTAVGPTVSVGRCWRSEAPQLCVDAEGVLFVAGGDLPERRIAAQIQIVVGVRFDVW